MSLDYNPGAQLSLRAQHPLIGFYRVTSFTSLHNKIRGILSSCCCLQAPSTTHPGWVATISIVSALLSVAISILLLPVKLVMLFGLCLCKPHQIQPSPLLKIETPSDSLSPPYQESLIQPPQEVVRESSVELTLKDFFELYFHNFPLDRIDVKAIALGSHVEELQDPNFSEEALFNLPASLFYPVPPSMDDIIHIPLLASDEEQSLEATSSEEEEGQSPAYPPSSAPTSSQKTVEAALNEDPSIWQKQFTDQLLSSAPEDWDFLTTLHQYAVLMLGEQQAQKLKTFIAKIADPEAGSSLLDPETQQTARAYLGGLLSLLTKASLPSRLKIEMLNNIYQHLPNCEQIPECLLPIIYDEMLALSFLEREYAISSPEEELACSGLMIHHLLPPLSSDANSSEVRGYISLLRQKFAQPLITRLDNIHLTPSTNALLQALAQPTPPWNEFKPRLVTLIQNLCGRTNRTTWGMQHILNRLSSRADSLIQSAEAEASARASMHLLYELMLRSDISNEDKQLVLSNIASYSDRCAPTWITETNAQLELHMNSNTQGGELILTWVQQFKHNLVHELYQAEPQWHIETAFKLVYQSQLGLEPGFIDPYTQRLTEYRSQLADAYYKFVTQYSECANAMVDYILDQALQASQEQQNTLMQLILLDLERRLSTHHVADVMEAFFPEENDYKPCRMAIIYLLIREGVLETIN